MCGMRRTIDYLKTITNISDTEQLAADLRGIFTPEAIEAINPAAIRAMHEARDNMAYLTQIEMGVFSVATAHRHFRTMH